MKSPIRCSLPHRPSSAEVLETYLEVVPENVKVEALSRVVLGKADVLKPALHKRLNSTHRAAYGFWILRVVETLKPLKQYSEFVPSFSHEASS